MIRSYVLFPWTWHWKSMISFDFYKKHCVLRSPEELEERAEYPAVPCAPPNCSTLCPSPVRQKDKNTREKDSLRHTDFRSFRPWCQLNLHRPAVREDIMTVDAHGSRGYWPPRGQEAGRERKVDPKNSILQRHVSATPFPPTRLRLLIAQSVGTHYELTHYKVSFLTVQSSLELMNLRWRAHSRSQP